MSAPSNTTAPQTMSVEQAGRLLGISRRSAYRAVAGGHLPVIRLGRRMLVPTHKLYALLGIPTGQVIIDPLDEPVDDEAPALDQLGLQRAGTDLLEAD